MNLNEFSHNFDILLNSYALPAQSGEGASRSTLALDEYEKSVLLTQSQEDIVLGYYNGRNTSGESFETVEETRRYLANLVMEDELSPMAALENNELPKGVSSTSKFFELPENLWFITYESITTDGTKCGDGYLMEVIPVTQDEYHRVRKNPFRGPNDRRALRLDLTDGIVEIVCKYDVSKYYLRYLRKPNPIILIDLSDGQTIDGVSEATECELHEALHQKILERAVLLALQSMGTYKNNESK